MIRAGKDRLSAVSLDFYFSIRQGLGAESFGGDEDLLGISNVVATAGIWFDMDICLSVAFTDGTPQFLVVFFFDVTSASDDVHAVGLCVKGDTAALIGEENLVFLE